MSEYLFTAQSEIENNKFNFTKQHLSIYILVYI